MKLEIHKDYELNDGSRMTVFRRDDAGDFWGVIHRHNKVSCWRSDGGLWGDNKSSPSSIRREWVEPKTMEVELWVNVYSNATHGTFQSEKSAINTFTSDAFARLHIKQTVVEGEGLTEEELKRKKP